MISCCVQSLVRTLCCILPCNGHHTTVAQHRGYCAHWRALLFDPSLSSTAAARIAAFTAMSFHAYVLIPGEGERGRLPSLSPHTISTPLFLPKLATLFFCPLSTPLGLCRYGGTCPSRSSLAGFHTCQCSAVSAPRSTTPYSLPLPSPT